jgi:hypothetical protein
VRRIIAAALATAFFVVSPPGAVAQEEETPAIENVPAEIEKLLEDYSRAWRTKDVALLSATTAGDVREKEITSLANARKVSFSAFTVRPTTQYSGDLATKRVRVPYKRAKDVAAFHVVEETRVGSETQTYVEEGAFTFVQTDADNAYGGWRLAAKDDLDVLGFFSPYHMWDEKPVSVLTSKRFTLLTHEDVVDELEPVLDVAEEAYDKATKFWPDGSKDHLVMLIPSTTAELGRILHETVDLDKFVAFVGAGAIREHGWTPTGPRVFVQLSHFDNYGRTGQFEIFAHELIHAITRDEAGPAIPAWIEEGLANLGGGDGGRPRVETAVPDAFPTDERFVTGGVRDIQAVYDQGQTAIDVLDKRFGRDGLMKFYRELGSRRVVAGTEEYHIRRAVEDSVGWSYDEWVAAWRDALGGR